MEIGKQIEIKIYKAIDILVDEMNQKYGITSKDNTELKLNDLYFKKALIDHILNLIKFRKTSERFLEDELNEVRYEINLEVSSQSLKQISIRKLI